MTSRVHPLESALAITLRALLAWVIPLTVVMLILRAPVDPDSLFVYNLTHLFVLQIASFLLVRQLAPQLDDPWFGTTKRPWLASAASIVALVTGFAALLTLATSAAAGYDPSLQFLQLLSSLDIAWATAALFLGAHKLWGKVWADVAAVGLIIVCIGSIALYLDAVGFTSSGGWQVDAAKMMQIVLPADMVAAAVAVTVLLIAARGEGQPTEHLSPQS